LKPSTRFYLILAFVILAVGLGCGGRQTLENLSPRQLFDLGKEKYDNEKYLTAIEAFQTIIYDYPGESLVDTAQYYLALSYYGNDDYVLARVEFERLFRYYPASTYVTHAQFMRAVSFYEGTPKNHGLDQTDLQEAIRQFEDFLIDNPESELMADCRTYLEQAYSRLAVKDYEAGMIYLRLGSYKAAKIYFQRVIDEHTSSKYGSLSLYHLAEIANKLKEYAEAHRQFRNFTLVYPEHEWAPKAQEKMNDAAFKTAESDYKNKEYPAAKEKLEAFITDHPDHDKIDNAREMLREIGNLPDETISATDESES